MDRFLSLSRRMRRAAYAFGLSLSIALFLAGSAPAQRGIVHQNPSIGKSRVAAMAAPTDIGARVYWFAIPTTGYGTPPISMIAPTATGAQVDGAGNTYILTDQNGQFYVTAQNACPSASSYMYIATMDGSTPGNSPNSAEAMMNIIPVTCGVSWFANVSETTTAVAAYALGAFAYLPTNSFSTSAASAPALAAAVSYASSLINSSTIIMPTGAAWVPTINTVADILARCIDIASTCPALFAATTPPGMAAPTNTFQAAVYIAMEPNLNLSSLFSQITASDPFQPVLSSLPASWVLPGSTANIVGISPLPAPVGATITLVGSGFGATQGSSVVVIGGVEATVTSWSNTAITVVIPAGAGTGGVAQVFVNGFGSNVVPFQVAAEVVPVIASISLSQGPVQMGFIVTGAKFGAVQGASSVLLGNVPLTILNWTPGAITVQIPNNAVTGNVVVTLGGPPGVLSNAVAFTVLPAIACPPL